jgi:hypothetical protein
MKETKFEFYKESDKRAPGNNDYESISPEWKKVLDFLVTHGGEGTKVHLGSINWQLLQLKDYEASEKVFSGEWGEKSTELQNYISDVLYFEKKKKQDSGGDPSMKSVLNSRINFSSMLRNYAIDAEAQRKLKERDNIKQ